jgi:hypothetical protein
MRQFRSIFDLSDQLGKKWRWLAWVLLLAIAWALYADSLFYNFVWDDWYYIKDNPLAREWSLAGLKAIWTSTHLGHYAPVTITVLAYLRHLFGLDPHGFHLAQLIVHSGCIVLVYFLLRKLESGRISSRLPGFPKSKALWRFCSFFSRSCASYGIARRKEASMAFWRASSWPSRCWPKSTPLWLQPSSCSMTTARARR